MCAKVTPAEFSRSLVRREPFDSTVRSGAAVLGARETVVRGRRAAEFGHAVGVYGTFQ